MTTIKSYLGWAALAVAIFLSGWWVQGWRKDAQIADLKSSHAQVLTDIASATTEAMRSTLQEERRRYAVVESARNEAEKLTQAAAGDAAKYRSAYSRLLNSTDKMVADLKREYPAIAEGGPTAGASIDMLAHMLGRIGEAAGELAAYGDAARNSGLICERTYDGLSEQP